MDLISVPFNTMPASIVSSILKSCLALRFSANVPGDFFFGIEFHLFVELFFLLTSFIFHFFIFVKWLVFGVTLACLFLLRWFLPFRCFFLPFLSLFELSND